MPEFSKLLRQRLATGTPADSHPDADTLTAFAEKLLPLGEQNRVLQHIAFCSHCREVIVLSQGALPAELPVAAARPSVATSARTGRRLWAPLFGLAASTAALAVVAVLIVRTPSQHAGSAATIVNQETKQEANVAPPLPPAVALEAPGAPAPRVSQQGLPSANASALTTTGSIKSRHAETTETGVEASAVPPVVASNRTSDISEIADSVVPVPRSRRNYLNDRALTSNQLQNVPRVNEIPGVGGAGYSAQLSNTFVNSGQLNFSELPSAVPSGAQIAGVQGREVGTTSLATSEHHFPVLGGVKRVTGEVARFRVSIVKPGQNAMFGLLNPGKTQSLEITSIAPGQGGSELDQTQAFRAPAMKKNAATAAAAPAAPTWVVLEGKLLVMNESGTWVSGYPGTDVEFSAVTSHGADVWAGGHRGALFHSRDGGLTWERIPLGESTTASVKSITTMEANVQVTMSDGQIWNSQDSGHSWTRK